MNKHTISTSYKSEGGTTVAKSADIEAELSINIELEVPASTTDMHVVVNVPYATLKSVCMTCTKKTGDSGTFTSMLVETNSGSAADDSFTITPTNGLIWSTGDPTANPLTADVTALYLTNSGSAVANFVLRALNDPTP